jgi:hypothetical protein
MKRLLSVTACLALVGCGQPAAQDLEAAKAAAAPTARAAEASQAAPVVVPVGDDNPLGIPDAVYPPLPSRFADAAAATPRGWRVEHAAEGDLNADGRADLVLVLHQQDPANLIRHDGFGEDPLDTNPRILAVGLARNGGYELVAQNHTLIPRRVEPNLTDPLEQPPAIRNGVLSVRLDFFASAGGWTMFNSTARLRWQDGGFRLIGHDYAEVARNTGQTVDRSVNFVTRRVSTARSSIDAETDSPAAWTRLPPGPLLTLDQVGDGLAFRPLPEQD